MALPDDFDFYEAYNLKSFSVRFQQAQPDRHEVSIFAEVKIEPAKIGRAIHHNVIFQLVNGDPDRKFEVPELHEVP